MGFQIFCKILDEHIQPSTHYVAENYLAPPFPLPFCLMNYIPFLPSLMAVYAFSQILVICCFFQMSLQLSFLLGCSLLCSILVKGRFVISNINSNFFFSHFIINKVVCDIFCFVMTMCFFVSLTSNCPFFCFVCLFVCC